MNSTVGQNADFVNLKQPGSPEDLFNQFFGYFKEACLESEIHREFLNVGESTIELVFAGNTLIEYLIPALSHLKSNPAMKPDLTICIWDSKSIKTSMPRLPLNLMEHTAEGLTFHDEHAKVIYQLGEHTLNMLNLGKRLALFYVPDIELLPYWAVGAPLRTILYLWVKNNDMQMVHSASVGFGSKGVLIAGKGGSGKSTTALACLKAGADYLGDDYVILSEKPQPIAYSLYNTGKLRKDHISNIPGLIPKDSNSRRDHDEKQMVFMNDHYSGNIRRKLPIKAILVPKITGMKDTKISPTSLMNSMMALGPSTIYQMPHAKQDVLTFLKSFIEKVPSYSIELGTDIAVIPGVIEHFLSGFK